MPMTPGILPPRATVPAAGTPGFVPVEGGGAAPMTPAFLGGPIPQPFVPQSVVDDTPAPMTGEMTPQVSADRLPTKTTVSAGSVGHDMEDVPAVADAAEQQQPPTAPTVPATETATKAVLSGDVELRDATEAKRTLEGKEDEAPPTASKRPRLDGADAGADVAADESASHPPPSQNPTEATRTLPSEPAADDGAAEKADIFAACVGDATPSLPAETGTAATDSRKQDRTVAADTKAASAGDGDATPLVPATDVFAACVGDATPSVPAEPATTSRDARPEMRPTRSGDETPVMPNVQSGDQTPLVLSSTAPGGELTPPVPMVGLGDVTPGPPKAGAHHVLTEPFPSGSASEPQYVHTETGASSVPTVVCSTQGTESELPTQLPTEAPTDPGAAADDAPGDETPLLLPFLETDAGDTGE